VDDPVRISATSTALHTISLIPAEEIAMLTVIPVDLPSLFGARRTLEPPKPGQGPHTKCERFPDFLEEFRAVLAIKW
jgi:hypothetical protein